MNKITKFFLIVGILALLGLMIFQMAKTQKMVVVKTDNIECKPLEIELGKYQDRLGFFTTMAEWQNG